MHGIVVECIGRWREIFKPQVYAHQTLYFKETLHKENVTQN